MKYSFLLSCVLLLLFAPPLLAQESYEEFERSLNLCEPQRIKLDDIKKKYMDELTYLKSQSARKRFELRRLGRYEPDRPEKAERARTELEQIEASKQRVISQYWGEVSAVLNGEQRDRFDRFTGWRNRKLVYPPRYRFHER